MQKTSIYNKLRVILLHLKKKSFPDPQALATFLAEQKLDEFKLRTKGAVITYCEPKTIRKTIGLGIRLKLITHDDQCALTADGVAANKNEASFKNMLAAGIVTYLGDHHFGIQTILDTIDYIVFPDLSEADIIYERGRTSDTEIDVDEFRRLLYLLALCDKLDRRVKYLYLRKRKRD